MTKLPHALCDACPLKAPQHKLVPGHGPSPDAAKAVIVGEAPGYDEARLGRPFVGRSGQLLHVLLKRTGLDPANIYMTNVVACHPPQNKISPSMVKCCRPRLMEELRPFNPPFCAAGATAAHALTRLDGSITSLRGRWFNKGRILPIFHPASILYTPGNLYTVLHDLRKLLHGGPHDIPEPEYAIVDSTVDLHAWVSKMLLQYKDTTLCFDIETDQTDFRKHDILCMAFAYEENKAFVIPRGLLYEPETAKALDRLFAPDNGLTFVGHNVKFDLRFIIHQLGVCGRAEYDSMYAEYVLQETGGLKARGLKLLLKNYFALEDYEGHLILAYLKNKNDFYSKIPAPYLMQYNACDVCYNLRLWHVLRARLEKEDQFERPFMFPVMASQDTIVRIELAGVHVDADRLLKVSNHMGEVVDGMHEVLQTMAGREFNPRSWKQVQPIMFDHFGMPMIEGRNYKLGSTCKDAREKILARIDPDSEGYKWLKIFGRYRSLSKVKASYVDPIFAQIDKEGRVHPDFNLCGTETGRMSVGRPPLHSIPRPYQNEKGQPDWGILLRSCFVAPPGYVIMMVDYSQAELRVCAGYSNDPFLIEQYANDADLHNETAVGIYGSDYTPRQRQLCKSYNFSQMYGGTIYAFAADSGMDLGVAQEFSKAYQVLVAGFVAWKAAQLATLKKQGYVETLLGRRRRFPLITRDNQDEARKAVVNAPVSGTASDFTVMSMIKIDHWLQENPEIGEGAYLILMVHDSVILCVRTDLISIVAQRAKTVMEGTATEWMPNVKWKADVDIGPSWGELERWTP